MSLLDELKDLCDPIPGAPIPSDSQRLQDFIRVGSQAIRAFEVISNSCVQLNHQVDTLVDIHTEQLAVQTRQIEELKKENRILKKMDKEANDSIVKAMKMRTHYTGDFPYHGWKGIGRALEEALDERDVYRATLEETQEELESRQPDVSKLNTIKSMVRGVFKMSHRKADA